MQEINIESIFRSRRKTVCFEITDRGTLIVKAPFSMLDLEIYKLIEKHKNWINKKIALTLTKERPPKRAFIEGENFLYLGKPYKLFFSDTQSEDLKFENAFYLKKDKIDFAKEVFINWYKKEAKRFILERLDYYARLTGINYNKVKINSATKRWGSCSKNRNLNFTYRLIMAPIFVVDYIVVHELCHVVKFNHSKEFWENVKAVLPNYRDAKNWLKEKGQTLSI
ncbi:MAG: M48 family metallopeptidase [Caldisericaceae bacterium]